MKIFSLVSFFILFYITVSLAQSWQKLDSLCYEYGDYKPDSAIIVGKKAIEGCIKEKGKNSLAYSVCLDHIAWAFGSKNNFAVGDSLYREAMLICKNLEKTQTDEYASIINNLAWLYEDQGEYAQAEPLYLEAKEIREKVLGKTHPEYTNSCDNLAELYKEQGKYSKAESLFTEAKEIRIKTVGKTDPDYAHSCNNLAKLYQTQGKYSQAELLYVEAKEIRAKTVGKTHPDYAHSCNNLALLYQNQGKYPQAEPLFIEAKQIRAKVLGKSHPDYALSCNNLAFLYMYQGKYAQAESLYKEAKEIQTKILGKTHLNYAQSCNNLAALYLKQKQYAQAELLFIEAKQIRAKVLGREPPSYATSCNNLALLYQNQRKYAQAESLYKEAKEIKSKSFGKMHPDYALACNNLGLLYEVQGNYEYAKLLYLEAKEIKASVLGKTHSEYIGSCICLARLYEKQKQYGLAEPLYLEAIFAKQQELERNFVNLSESEKELYLQANTNRYFNDFQKFIAQYAIQKPEISMYGYELSLNTKGLILNSTEKIKNRILGSNNQSLIQLYLEWKNTKDIYNKALNITIEQRKERKLNTDSLQNKSNEYEKELALKSEDFANVFSPKRTAWQDIQKKLQKNEANVEIVKYEISKDSIGYLAYIIKKDTKYPETVVFKNGNELEKTVMAYRRAIRSKIVDDYSYNIFWQPIQERLKGIRQVFFCPDGVYYQINLNTLQNPDTKKEVIDEIKITQLTNSKDILSSKKHTQKGIYLFGGPKFETDNTPNKNNQRSVENRDFSSGVSELEGAEKEVKSIDSLIKMQKTPIFLYTQYDATEELVKSLKNPRILHIATHGYFKKGNYQSAEQAMRNAGLLMSGVVDIDRMEIRPFNKEDGKLTAFEIMNMELDSTELVVLSACETGLGEVSKEGVYGLQRAFKVAGASTIIMSLWKVDDQATQQLMQKFYYYWQTKKMDKKSAFLKSQAELRKTNPEPYYWGAFVMIE